MQTPSIRESLRRECVDIRVAAISRWQPLFAGTPEVYHKHSMTSHVSARRVLGAIAKTAFPAGVDGGLEPSASDLQLPSEQSSADAFQSKLQRETHASSAPNKPSCRASHYPVILSLEMHCSLEQQGTLAHLLQDAFGSRLLLPLDPTFDLSSDLSSVDSPHALIGKVRCT